MSRNVVAITSSVLFVCLAIALVLVPVPYVTWRPGQTIDVLSSTDAGQLIEVKGLTSYESEGKLLMTTVSQTRVDALVSLPEALVAYLSGSSDALPKELIYPAGKSQEQLQDDAVASMDSSRSNATVAALRAAGHSVTEMPVVSGVSTSGPANGKLEPADLIETVDGKEVSTPQQVAEFIKKRGVGEPVVFEVKRDGSPRTVSVLTIANRDGTPSVGITVSIGYEYAPLVNYRIDSSIVGASAGLVFALAVYDRITEGELLPSATVAATGVVDATGQVSAIGGVREKLAGAADSGAEVFVIPVANCADLKGIESELRIVPVASLKEAISALQLLAESPTKENQGVPSCE